MKDIIKKISVKNALILIVLCTFIYSAFLTINPPNKIAVLEITGVIRSPKAYLKSIEEFLDDESIKAVIIRIDSPGGTVGSSQEIYNSLINLNESKLVVSSIVDIGASGGYMIACGSSYIFANPGSITGSIGVITQYYDLSKLIKYLKVNIEVVKSGELKDIGTPRRELTEDEKKILSLIIEDVHSQFKQVVKDRRKLSEKEIELVADGRIFSGNQAKKLKLVDATGGLESAIKYIEDILELEDLDIEYFPKKKEKLLDKIIPEIKSEYFEKLYYLYNSSL
ncbi:MAG: signal peptide peptidase SppA [Thermodesulfobacteriota bacterium]|nr:signal peptide peptidase SppA [Thermodesulfobacteriota bacterium]|tara:strand:+ start:1345 stop:2187 length:843 start_codon:yes stop_codon:yes gene_type:complete